MAYQSDRRLSELAAFAAAVAHGGFSAAARAAGLRKATLSERVRALEERLAVTLHRGPQYNSDNGRSVD